MINGKEKIKAYFSEAMYPYFKVYKLNTVSSGNAMIESGTDEAIDTPSNSYAKFSRWLDLQSIGRFTLILFDKEKATKGKLIQDFELSYGDTAAPQAVLSGIPQVDPAVQQQQAESRAQEMFDQRMIKWQLEQAEKRVAELEKELKVNGNNGKSGWDKFLDVAGPHLGTIFPEVAKVIFPTKPAPFVGKAENVNMPRQGVAGTGEVHDMEEGYIITDNGENSPETAILKEFVDTLQKNDPNEWLQIIERMTAKMKENPAIISTLKMFLGWQV